jgi:hypothetical protein
LFACWHCGLTVIIVPPINNQKDVDDSIQIAMQMNAKLCITDVAGVARLSISKTPKHDVLRFHCFAYPVLPPLNIPPPCNHEMNAPILMFANGNKLHPSDAFNLNTNNANSQDECQKINMLTFSAYQILEVVNAMAGGMNIRSTSTILSRLPHYSIHGLFLGILCPLLNGAKAVLSVDKNEDMDVTSFFANAVDDHNTTHVLLDTIIANKFPNNEDFKDFLKADSQVIVFPSAVNEKDGRIGCLRYTHFQINYYKKSF